MSNASTPPQSSDLSPCIGTCRLDGRGFCVGCQRTGEEIGRWRMMSDAERRYVMAVVLPERKSS